MPRLGYETPCRPVPKPSEGDRFLFVVKFATFVVAIGLLGGFYLVSGGTSREPGHPAAAPAPTTTTSPARPSVVVPPVASTMTSEVGPPPAPATTEPPPETTTPAPRRQPPPARDERFAVVGQACPTPGMYSLTSRYWPVVCRGGKWHPVTTG